MQSIGGIRDEWIRWRTNRRTPLLHQPRASTHRHQRRAYGVARVDSIFCQHSACLQAATASSLDILYSISNGTNLRNKRAKTGFSFRAIDCRLDCCTIEQTHRRSMNQLNNVRSSASSCGFYDVGCRTVRSNVLIYRYIESASHWTHEHRSTSYVWFLD